MAEPQYTKPNSQLDLERRNSDDYEDRSLINLGNDAGKSENGYIGTDPIYQNHANDTEAPKHADPEESVEQKLMDENFLADDVDYDSTGVPEGQHSAEEADEVEPTPTTPGPSSASTPPPPSSGSGND